MQIGNTEMELNTARHIAGNVPEREDTHIIVSLWAWPVLTLVLRLFLGVPLAPAAIVAMVSVATISVPALIWRRHRHARSLARERERQLAVHRAETGKPG